MAESDVRTFIVFKVLAYYWALPIEVVLRVVNCSLDANRELISMGVIQIGRHVIRALDLHRRLSLEPLPRLPRDSPFLIITPVSEGELCGIPVDEPPDLVEAPSDMVRSLPPSSTQVGLLEIVSGVIVFSPEQAHPRTILLLDVKRALSASLQESLSLPTNTVVSGVE